MSLNLTTGTFFPSENFLAVFKIKDERGREREHFLLQHKGLKKKSVSSLNWFGYKKVRDGSEEEVKVEN